MNCAQEGGGVDSLNGSATIISDKEDDIDLKLGEEEEQGKGRLPLFMDEKFLKYIPEKSDRSEIKKGCCCVY